MSLKSIFDPSNKYYIFIKGILYLFTFQAFHFLYDLIPVVPVNIIAAIDESPWEHFKIGFYVYVLWTIIEYFAFKSKIERRQEYLFGGFLAAIITPWIIITIWYIMPALHGPFAYEWQEMIWAIISTYICILIIHTFHQAFAKMEFPTFLRVIILVIMGIMVMNYTIFSFQKPWADVFTPAVVTYL
jgi:hypothetical protein